MHRRDERACQPIRCRRSTENKNVPAEQRAEPADHALGRSRGGWGSKLHLVTDGQGTPLAVEASAGQAHECRHVEPVMNAVRIGRRRRPRRLAGDKGYSYGPVRRWLRQHRVEAVIPTKSNQPKQARFDRRAYRRRNVVERCVNWMKENRRLGTRYEKLPSTLKRWPNTQ